MDCGKEISTRQSSIFMLSKFLHGYQDFSELISAMPPTDSSTAKAVEKNGQNSGTGTGSEIGSGSLAKNGPDRQGILRGKLRNLQLSNLLYGYQDYTDDKVLKKMVGFSANSPTEKSPESSAPENEPSFSKGKPPLGRIISNPERPETETDQFPDREIGLVITMTSKNHQSTTPKSRIHEETLTNPRSDQGSAPSSAQEAINRELETENSKLRFDKFSNRLDAMMNKVRSTAPIAERASQHQREPSYTHAIPHAVTSPVIYFKNPNTNLQQRRLHDVLPPILLHCSTSGRVVAARSSSIDEELPRPFFENSSEKRLVWAQDDGQNHRTFRETLV